MKPVPDWRRVLRHSWSIRLAVLSAVCDAASGGLSLVDPVHRIAHPVLFPVLGFGLALAAGGARLIQQKKLSGLIPWHGMFGNYEGRE